MVEGRAINSPFGNKTRVSSLDPKWQSELLANVDVTALSQAFIQPQETIGTAISHSTLASLFNTLQCLLRIITLRLVIVFVRASLQCNDNETEKRTSLGLNRTHNKRRAEKYIPI